MKTLSTLALVFLLSSLTVAQLKSYCGGRYEGDGVTEGYKVCVDFSGRTMIDTMYYVHDNYLNYTVHGPDKPTSWIPVFKAVVPFPCHLRSFRIAKDSLYFQTDKYTLEGGDWVKFSFSGARTPHGIKGILRSQFCSQFETSKVYTDKNVLSLVEMN